MVMSSSERMKYELITYKWVFCIFDFFGWKVENSEGIIKLKEGIEPSNYKYESYGLPLAYFSERVLLVLRIRIE